MAKRIAKQLAASALIGMTAISGMGLASAESFAGASASSMPSTSDSEHGADIWFDAEDGTRTFDTEGDSLIPHLLPGDEMTLDGDVLNVTNSKGELVASLKADLPDGVVLRESDGAIRAIDESSPTGIQERECIGNKWVGWGINVVGDVLVCAPFGVATGGAGAIGCGAAVGAGVAAASC